MKKYILTILIGLLMFAAPAYADTYVLNGIQYTGTHIPRFTGDIYFVDAAQSDDTGIGLSPHSAKKTIGAAITAASAGDAINIKAGTYTEVGLNVNKQAMEIWCEIGVIISPATGTALILSGDYVKLTGMHRITPAAAQIGLQITGDFCHVEHGMVMTGGTGMQITGDGAMVYNYASGLQTVAAYDIRGNQARLTDCKTVGNAATIGYWINSNASIGVLTACTSVGHQTSGYQIDTGSSAWTMFNCSSGNGDGRWVDTDHANVWSNFSFDDEIYHLLTFPVGAGSENLFKITGSVNIIYIYGRVEEAIHADVNNLKLELYDGSASDITANVDTASAPLGSLFFKTKALGEAMSLDSGAAASLNEDSTGKKGAFGFIITAKNTGNTYIRATWTGAAGGGVTGKIDWHVQWEPLTDAGFVSAP